MVFIGSRDAYYINLVLGATAAIWLLSHIPEIKQEDCQLPAVDLISRCEATLKQIHANAPIAICYAIDAVNKGVDTDLTSGLTLDAKYFALAAGTEDKMEGTSALVHKRAPHFRGK